MLGGIIDAVDMTSPLEVLHDRPALAQAYANDYVNPSRQAEQIVDLRMASDLPTSGCLERMWGRPIAGRR